MLKVRSKYTQEKATRQKGIKSSPTHLISDLQRHPGSQNHSKTQYTSHPDTISPRRTRDSTLNRIRLLSLVLLQDIVLKELVLVSDDVARWIVFAYDVETWCICLPC